jgi:hypothetical protein
VYNGVQHDASGHHPVCGLQEQRSGGEKGAAAAQEEEAENPLKPTWAHMGFGVAFLIFSIANG